MKPERLIYLDHAATTPTDPRVIEAMLPYFGEVYGNPSSSHRFGRQAEKALGSSRETLARLLNCATAEVVFTSCGTESDNLALRGPILASGRRAHIITAHTEHHAVSHTAAQLRRLAGVEVTWLEVDHEGRIAPETLKAALEHGPDGDVTTIVSVMLANNEIGALQPIRALADVAHAYGALFHTDAVQAGGQILLDVQALGVDMLSLTAHKFYGPKGVGLLYVRKGITLEATQTGGGQESERRSGTHNVPLIVGMAKALELAYIEHETLAAHYRTMRNVLIAGLTDIDGISLSGAPGDERLPNHASFVIADIDANALLMHLDLAGIAASSGSACNTGNPSPSEVLLALGYPPELALGSLRLTVGRQTTREDVDYAVQVVGDAVRKLRKIRALQRA